MEYTGERVLPGKKGLELLELEHRTRYVLAQQYAGDKRVLDLGSGSGYGSAMLADVAAKVLGIDIADEAVEYARNAFDRPNLSFLQGDLCAKDLMDRIRAHHPESFDCITCFEVIEHIDEPITLLNAVVELLTPDGCLIISTPNVDFPYDVDKVNPYHVVEYSLHDFERTLKSRFKQVQISGQQVHLCSTVGYGPEQSLTPVPWRMHQAEAVKYYVAVCSNREEALTRPEASLLTGDAHLKILQSKLQELRQNQGSKAERIQFLQDLSSDQKTQLEQERAESTRLRRRMQQAEAALEKLQDDRQDLEKILQQQRYFEKRIHELHQDNRRLRADLGRQVQELRNEPALRRLLRFNRLGLKLLGFFGLGGRQSKPSHGRAARRESSDDDSKGDPWPGIEKLSFEAVLQKTADHRSQKKHFDILPPEARERFRRELQPQPQDQLVSIIMPTFNRAEKIREPIDSILRQDYKNWELIIVDDGSTDDTQAVVAAYQAEHANIRYEVIDHEGVSAARDRGLKVARGTIVAYLDSDNHWLDDYLLYMVHAMETMSASCAYAGMRIIDHDEKHKSYLRRRHFNLRDLQKNNYIDINVFMHRRKLFEDLGGFDRDLRRWVDWDLILRYVEHFDPLEVPIIGANYNREKKLNQITLDEPQAFKFKVLNKHLVNWEALEAGLPQRKTGFVSIVIPVFNQLALTQACIRSLMRSECSRDFEIILVDNGSNEKTARGLARLAEQHPAVHLISNYENYWFSLGNNIGVSHSTGEYVVLLNNDTEVTDHWLDALIDPLEQDASIGATGPKLLYSDGTVQAAGFAFSDRSKIPYHIYRNAPADAPYVNKPREFQALTGACLAVRAADYIALRGLDPVYANGGEDLDFCFALRFRQQKSIRYVPASVVYHHEGKTEGRSRAIMYNRSTFVERWADRIEADDTRYYQEDGFEVVAYTKPGREADGETAAYVPELRRDDGLPVPGAAYRHVESEAPAAKATRTLNLGIVSIWHVRGITLLTKQLTDALDGPDLRTHIFARWESERFDNSGPVWHPRVTNGGDDPTAADTVAWARENQLDAVLFMEAHPKDWKRVAALKEAGIRVLGYENMDVMRWEHLEQYGEFELLLSIAFFAHDVFQQYFPETPALCLPWGTAPEALPEEALVKQTPDGRIDFVHVAGWGGVNNRKNTDTLIRAFAQAAPANAVLHVYTQAPIDRYGSDCARMLQDSTLFQVHEGTIPNIFEAYRNKDMLLWPSKREGLGLPITESLACGLPVLISDGYLMKQWIVPGEHGVVVPTVPVEGRMYLPEVHVDERELAETIRNVCEAPEQLAGYRECIQRDAAVWRWDWQPTVLREQLLRFLSEADYVPPTDLSYIPASLREFENRRRAAFGEPALGAGPAAETATPYNGASKAYKL